MKTLPFPTSVPLQTRSHARHPEPLGKLRFGSKGEGPHIRLAIKIPGKTSKVSHTTLGKLRFRPKGVEFIFFPYKNFNESYVCLT